MRPYSQRVILLLVMILTPEASSSPLSVSAVAKTMSHAAVDVDCAAEEGGYRSVVLPEFAILDEIVRFSGSYHDREEEATCKRMVDQLSEDEQSIAARTSYAFWAWELLCTTTPSSESSALSSRSSDIDDVRHVVAMREARRHLRGQDGDYDSALVRLRGTLQWRNETKIDLLKVCFSEKVNFDGVESASENGPSTTRIRLSDEDAKHCVYLEQLIAHDLNVQKMAVRGRDKQHRPILVKFCREIQWSSFVESCSSAHDAEHGFFIAQVYLAERAIAVAELSKKPGENGPNERLTAIFDFGSYDSAHAPPTHVMVSTLKALQGNYPERLGQAVVLDAPFWMQALMQIVNVFLSQATRDKLTMVGGSSISSMLVPMSLWSSSTSTSDIRHSTLKELVDPDQAMSFMLPNGKLTGAIDVTHLVRHVPFFELYDVDSSFKECRATGP